MNGNDAVKMAEYGVNAEQYACLALDRNIAVAAGAGSGKTRVLTRRYLRLLKEDPAAGVDNIVAITFTEKAALEMRERVRQLLDTEQNRAADPAAKRKWQAARGRIAGANISTIHSWCSGILRENCAALGLDPAFAVMDDVDRKTALLRLARETMAESLGEAPEGATALLEFGGADYWLGDGLVNDLVALYGKIREAGLTAAEAGRRTEAAAKTAAWHSIGEEGDPAALERLNKAEMYIARLLAALDGKYAACKRRERVLDFNDLELAALQALSRPEIVRSCRERFRHYLIDEFQDTNELQRKILYALLHDGSALPSRGLFIVGDRQQAIYGFRGADHRIFAQVSADIGAAGQRALSTCYRSTPNIINTINAIFPYLLTPYQRLEVAPEKAAPAGKKVELITFPREKRAPPDGAWKTLQKLIKDGGTEAELREAFARLDAATAQTETADREAEILAGRIGRLIAGGYEYSDIAVLLRSRTRLPAYEHSLRRHGIPFCILGGLGFFERQEIRDIINTYKIVFDPADRIALVGALRSPLFALSDSTLVDLFAYLSETPGDLDAALERLAAAAGPEQAGLVRRAQDILAGLADGAGFYSAGELLDRISAATHYPEILLTQPDGCQRYRNLEKLTALTAAFDAKEMYTPRQFPAYLANLAEAAAAEGDAALDTEDSDAVKIMTIHAAKGLEFRAVIIPDAGKDLLRMAARHKPKLVFSPQFGITARSSEDNTKNPLYEAHYEKACKRELDEAKRLLYVAATRAEEFLAFIGEGTGKIEKDNPKNFVQMLKIGLNECGGSLDSLTEVDGLSLLPANPPAAAAYEQRTAGVAARDFAAAADGENRDDRIYWEYQGSMGMQASVSQYLAYQACPRYYYLRYRAGLELTRGTGEDEAEERPAEREERLGQPDPPENSAAASPFLSAVARGTIVHRLLEKLTCGRGGSGQLAAAIAAELQNGMPGLSGDAAAEKQAEIARCLRNCFQLDAQTARRHPGRLVSRAAELPFRLPLDSEQTLGLNGVIDRVDVYEQGSGLEAVIIDYKTNRADTPERAAALAARYRPQLLVYGEAVRRLYRHDGLAVRPGGIYLYLLASGECKEITWDEGEAVALLAGLTETFTYIARNKAIEAFAPVRSARCPTCEYRELCDAFKEV